MAYKTYTLQYKATPRYLAYKTGALKRGLVFELTAEEFNALTTAVCFYCGTSGPNGVDRQDNHVGYTVGNCVTCCKHCNYAKGALTIEDFMIWLRRFKTKKF